MLKLWENPMLSIEDRMEAASGEIERLRGLLEKASEFYVDAARYRWLRKQQIDLKAPALGVLNHGIFIGKIPDNVVLSEADADAAIDAVMTV